jgi:hypothetical protein
MPTLCLVLDGTSRDRNPYVYLSFVGVAPMNNINDDRIVVVCGSKVEGNSIGT